MTLGETSDGQRENLYRLGSGLDTMTMEVTVTSARLPEPVRYTLTFTRAKAGSRLGSAQER